MPCWNKIETTLDLKNPNLDMLRAALENLGFAVGTPEYARQFDASLVADHYGNRVSIRVKTDGTVVIGGPNGAAPEHVNAVKRAYSTQIVLAASKRFGWNVKKVSERQMMAQRRF